MIPWLAVLRALPVTFFVYLVQACAALLLGLPAALEVTHSAPSSYDASARAAWLELALTWAPAWRVLGTTALLTIAILLLLSPWLQMAWLAAISTPMGL